MQRTQAPQRLEFALIFDTHDELLTILIASADEQEGAKNGELTR